MAAQEYGAEKLEVPPSSLANGQSCAPRGAQLCSKEGNQHAPEIDHMRSRATRHTRLRFVACASNWEQISRLDAVVNNLSDVPLLLVNVAKNTNHWRNRVKVDGSTTRETNQDALPPRLCLPPFAHRTRSGWGTPRSYEICADDGTTSEGLVPVISWCNRLRARLKSSGSIKST